MSANTKSSREHFLVYFDLNQNIVCIKPREWSRKNTKHFQPKYTFINNDAPKDNEIETYLKTNYGFVEFTYEKVVVLCNFDTDIPPNKAGIPFQ